MSRTTMRRLPNLAYTLIFWAALLGLVRGTEWVVTADFSSSSRLALTILLVISFTTLIAEGVRRWWKDSGRYDESAEQQRRDTEAFVAQLQNDAEERDKP